MKATILKCEAIHNSADKDVIKLRQKINKVISKRDADVEKVLEQYASDKSLYDIGDYLRWEYIIIKVDSIIAKTRVGEGIVIIYVGKLYKKVRYGVQRIESNNDDIKINERNVTKV